MIDNPAEIECRLETTRRFLLGALPEGLSRHHAHVQITDNYVTNTSLRLRYIRTPATKSQRWILQKKYVISPHDLSRTMCASLPLSPAEFEVFSIFEGNEIRKNRYPFQFEGHRYSIDIFLGALWGLILAKTCFPTAEEAGDTYLPSFALQDVTNDEFFTGARLTDLTFGDVQAHVGQGFGQTG